MKGEETDIEREEIRKEGKSLPREESDGSWGAGQRGRNRTEGTPHPGSLQVRRAKPGVSELRGARARAMCLPMAAAFLQEESPFLCSGQFL